MHVGNRDINGVDCEVHAESRTDQWFIYTPKEEGEENGTRSRIGIGDTLDNAVAEARKTINKRKVKFSVPFIDMSGGEKGEVYGIHGRTGAMLARISDQKGIQIAPSYRVFKADTPGETLSEYFLAKNEIQKQQKIVRQIESEWTINSLKAQVEQAIEAAQEES